MSLPRSILYGDSPAFPDAGIDTVTFHTYAPLTPLGTQLALGRPPREHPKFADPYDPDEPVTKPLGALETGDDDDAVRTVVFGKQRFAVRHFRAQRYWNCVGVFDAGYNGGRRLLFTIRTSHKYKRGFASLTVNRVAWRYGRIGQLWNVCIRLFDAQLWNPYRMMRVYQLDLYVDAPGAFAKHSPHLLYHGGAATNLYDWEGGLLYHSHRLRKGDRPSAQATGIMFGRPSGQQAARVYDAIAARSTEPGSDSAAYMNAQNVDEDGCLPDVTRFESIKRGACAAELLGVETGPGGFADLMRLPYASDYFDHLRLRTFAERGPRYRNAVKALREKQERNGIHRTLAEYRRGKRPSACPQSVGAYPKRNLCEPRDAPPLDSTLRSALHAFCGTTDYQG